MASASRKTIVAADDRQETENARFQAYRRSGDVGLRNQLVEEHLTLARAFARRYSQRGAPLEDLELVAQMALIGAVERFDPGLGVRFSTFAGRTIDGELKRHFRDKAWSVKVPATIKTSASPSARRSTPSPRNWAGLRRSPSWLRRLEPKPTKSWLPLGSASVHRRLDRRTRPTYSTDYRTGSARSSSSASR